MSGLTTAYLGFGANLGDAVQQLVDARCLLSRWQETSRLRCSSLYLSSPVGYAAQADYINCVVEVMTSASAQQLFTQTQLIEDRLGRQRVPGNQNAPRTIDIDLLLFGDQTIATDLLTVPHPRMSERLFVLTPLAELLEESSAPKLEWVNSLVAEGQFDGQVLHRLSL